MRRVYVSRTAGRRGDLRRVGRWARLALGQAGLQGELSIVLTDDDGIRELNHTWRGTDQPTDVLSFPQDGAAGPLLGDVVISVQTALRQAVERGHDLDTELAVLLVHGICHLLGHDHHEPGETKAMRQRESAMLHALRPDAIGLIERSHSG